MGPLQQKIENTLRTHFASAEHILVENESHTHSVPPGSETHFLIVVVDEKFSGLSRLARHRAVQEALGPEVTSRVRALSIRPLTPRDWGLHNQVEASPGCRGGSLA